MKLISAAIYYKANAGKASPAFILRTHFQGWAPTYYPGETREECLDKAYAAIEGVAEGTWRRAKQSAPRVAGKAKRDLRDALEMADAG